MCDVGGSDRIHSKEVSDALTEVLREDTCLPQAAGGNIGFISCESAVPAGVASTKPTSPTGCDGRDRLSKKVRTNNADLRSVCRAMLHELF